MVGLKRGEVAIVVHQTEWREIAAVTIRKLKKIFGDTALDIQHIGSTAIDHIKAKPMIDIAVGVARFDALADIFPKLEGIGVYKSSTQPLPGIILCAIKETRESDIVLCNLHLVEIDSVQWKNHINFRDYMNVFPQQAAVYEKLKIKLAGQYPNDREAYSNGKKEFIENCLFDARVYKEMRHKLDITVFEPITKGWSGDKKYYIKTAAEQQMFLRISDISEFERKKAEHEMMRRMYETGVPIAQPLEFDLCDDSKNVYCLSGWVDGKDAESFLPLMSETEQYVLGLKAGETLRKIHSLTVPDSIANWQERYFSVIDERIEAYHSEGTPFEGNKKILEYYDCNRNLLYNRPQCFLHGDFHEGNLMVSDDGELYVIDLLDEGFGNYGDPWYDFKTFGENDNAYFSTGLVRGYFNGEPTQAFWDVLTYYVITAAITSIVWMKYHKPDELPETLSWNEKNARFLREGHSPLMKWYLPDFYIQYTDGVPYRLKTPFDFSFLSKYGKVFKVYDAQDSGNICFGVAKGDNRYFIKFAGAPTERACVTADEAIANLKRTVPIYQDLTHPNLIKFISAEEIGGGFAMVFEWVDAECMHPMYPMSRKKFMQMTTATRFQVFDDILAFFAHIAKQGYVAIDFYDGSIMYDFNTGRTVICDIDLFEKMPYINNMGRMWGSSRFMSPEEFALGAAIDEITNVYTLGAMTFALFGDERDRCLEKWKLRKDQFSVAKKAVSDERDKRQQSIEQLITEWRATENMITYRKATADDVRPALDLALRVFMEFEAAEYEPEAIPRFKADIINNEVAIQNWTCGKNSMHVACDGDQIVGVIGEKWGNGHINIVFVEGQYHRRGIATELMNHIICDLKLRGFDKITLFSSPYGLLFYRQYGFVPTDVEQHSDGFIFTPMEYIQTRYGMPSTKTEIKQGVTLSEAGKWRPEIITSLFMCGSTTAGANG